MASKKEIKVSARLPPTEIMPAPMKRAKMMMGRMSAFAMEAMGFVGIMATKTCMMVGASFTFGASAVGRAMPTPGSMARATAKPMTMAMAVVMR